MNDVMAIFYFRYCRGLKFSQTPDYDYLKGLFRACLIRHKFKEDGVFDWSPFDGNVSLQDTSLKVSNGMDCNTNKVLYLFSSKSFRNIVYYCALYLHEKNQSDFLFSFSRITSLVISYLREKINASSTLKPLLILISIKK